MTTRDKVDDLLSASQACFFRVADLVGEMRAAIALADGNRAASTAYRVNETAAAAESYLQCAARLIEQEVKANIMPLSGGLPN